MKGGGKPTFDPLLEQVSLKLTPEMKEKLVERAEREGKSPGVLARELVIKGLEE